MWSEQCECHHGEGEEGDGEGGGRGAVPAVHDHAAAVVAAVTILGPESQSISVMTSDNSSSGHLPGVLGVAVVRVALHPPLLVVLVVLVSLPVHGTRAAAVLRGAAAPCQAGNILSGTKNI